MRLYRESFSVDPYQTDRCAGCFPNPSGKALVKMQVTSAPLVRLNNGPACSYSCSLAGGEVYRNRNTHMSWLIGWNTVVPGFTSSRLLIIEKYQPFSSFVELYLTGGEVKWTTWINSLASKIPFLFICDSIDMRNGTTFTVLWSFREVGSLMSS